MDDEEYSIEFEKFLRERIPDFFNHMEEGCRKNFVDNTTLAYFHRFMNRFRAMMDYVENHNIRPKRIADLGSWYPYASYYFKLKDSDVSIDLYDIIGLVWNIEPYDVDGVRLHNFDLCKDVFPDEKYDLIFFSEALEHLPCNLFEVEKRVMSILEDGGYLIVTYPCLGDNARDYEKDYDREGLIGEHLRDFTPATAKLFFNDLKTIEMNDFYFPGYGPTVVAMYKG